MENLLETYNGIQECHYKNEHYSVRDNGAVLRYPRVVKKRTRPTDNQWTFGKPNDKTGYMGIASVRVHRIVATAFHGVPPTKEHVVDHKDTNKRNNRPENLRWVTKLENALLNPITAKRIAIVCGSVEEFLADPSKFRDKFQEPNVKWMCTVSIQEAKISLERMLAWSRSDKRSFGGSLGKWIFDREKANYEQRIEEIFKKVEKKTGLSRKELCFNKLKRNHYYEARKYAAKLLRSELNLSDYEIGKLIGLSAITVNLYLEVCTGMYSGDYAEVREKEFKKRFEITLENFIQKNWRAQYEFPSCPQKVLNNPIAEYATQLEDNTIFFQNSYSFTTVIQSTIIDKGKAILVMYEITKKESTVKRWGMMKITFENEKFVHKIVTNYNGTLEHYWLIDVENHFNSIVEGHEWVPLYDSQGKEFKGGYMPL